MQRQSGRKSRVLVLVPGSLDGRLSGPEIRAVRLAQVLLEDHEVTLMAEGTESDSFRGMPVVPYSRRALLRAARCHDFLMAAAVPPFALLLKRWLKIVTICDLYDPIELEMSTLEAGAAQARDTARAARLLQLIGADIVVCAGNRQYQALGSELRVLGGHDRTLLCNVPFGIDPEPPASDINPLRDHFPQIGANDEIVLWWGSLWRWLDAETAISAFASIADSHPHVKLVFTGGQPPNADTQRHSVVNGAVEKARRLGVLNDTVFFLDEWVPFEQRSAYLQDADLGLTLHRNTEEAAFAARARYMDYLWTGLPCVLGRGDETAETFGAAGFASLVEPQSRDATIHAVLRMLEGPNQLRAKKASHNLRREFRWKHVAAPLLRAIGDYKTEYASPGPPPSLTRALAYYFRRLSERLGGFAVDGRVTATRNQRGMADQEA